MKRAMDTILKQGRLVFAVAIVAFGVQHLICARFGQAHVPVIPWVPGNPVLAYITGLALIATGVSITANFKPRLAATLLGVFFLVCAILLQAPMVVSHPLDIGIRTLAFETLATCASALMLAATLPEEGFGAGAWQGVINGLIKSGRYLFAISSVIFGIDHFFVLGLIVSLVPTWLPGSGMFWAVLTGAGFIAAGLSIATNWMGRLGAAWLGIMFLLWFLILHAPRVVTFPRSHNPNEWSSAFIALGMCGGSWICAWALSAKAPVKFSAAQSD